MLVEWVSGWSWNPQLESGGVYGYRKIHDDLR